MNYLKLTIEPLDVGKISNMALLESCGAVSIFVGTTRDFFEEKKVKTLQYEAYEPMALNQLELICKELRSQWESIGNIVIFHRLGLVGIGEASVVIAISSPHRETALKSVEAAIDDLKKRVPIWKKEIYEGEEQSTWKENKESKVSFTDEPRDFNENMCLVEDSGSPPSQVIQINVSEEEISRRIQRFVEKKRNEIDLCNIMDFTNMKHKDAVPETNSEETDTTESESMTCARVSCTVVKQEYSKCHLKVSQVKNDVGPQTSSNYLNTLDKLMVPTKKYNNEDLHCFAHERESKRLPQTSEEYYLSKHPTIMERLKNIEGHLNIPQNQTRNIYQRLKVIEDRLIFLESISPEYGHFLIEKYSRTDNNSVRDVKPYGVEQFERKTYSTSDIERMVKKLSESKPDHHDSIKIN